MFKTPFQIAPIGRGGGQTDPGSYYHRRRKPEEHPVKNLVVLILAARTLSFVEHCHPSFYL